MEPINSEYKLLAKQLEALLLGERNKITNLSLFAALVFNSLSEVNWAGFYLVNQGKLLKLGPFQGQVACSKINWGTGVCGTAALNNQSLIVSDVDQFDGHIVCDSRSRSELVCPVIYEQQLIGVFDIDSPILARFDDQDRAGIENLILTLVKMTDWQEPVD